MNPLLGSILMYVVLVVVGMIVFYLLVRLAVKHGVTDALAESQRDF